MCERGKGRVVVRCARCGIMCGVRGVVRELGCMRGARLALASVVDYDW